MKKKIDDLKVGLACYFLLAVILVQMILLVAIYAQLGDIQEKMDIDGQVYGEKVHELTGANTALLEENEMLKDSYADMAGDIKAVREILEQINYEAILAEPEAVDLWLQVAAQTLEGE